MALEGSVQLFSGYEQAVQTCVNFLFAVKLYGQISSQCIYRYNIRSFIIISKCWRPV